MSYTQIAFLTFAVVIVVDLFVLRLSERGGGARDNRVTRAMEISA